MKITHTLLLLLLALPSTAQQTLWRISSPQTKQASYLFGTTYSNAPNAFNFNDSVLVAFRKSKGFAMETNYDSLFQYLSIAKYEEGTNNPIRSILSKEEYAFADSLVFKRRREHIEDLQTKHLTVVASRITGDKILPLVGPEYPQFWLSLQADKLGKTTYGLEKAQNQVKVLFPDTVLPAFKKYFLSRIGYLSADGTTPDQHLESRAEEMAANFIRLSRTTSIFAAIDTLYIPGLIQQLRRQGYKVTPVNAATTDRAKQDRAQLENDTWFALNKPEEGFSVLLPSYPKKSRSADLENEKYYIGGNKTSGGIVAIRELTDMAIPRDTIVAEILKKYTKKQKLASIPTKHIVYKRHNGIEISVREKEGMFSLRMFLVNNRVFTFIYAGQDTIDRDRLFNSVKLYDIRPQTVYDSFTVRGGAATVLMPANRFSYREATYTHVYKAADYAQHISYFLRTELPPAGGQADDGTMSLTEETRSPLANASKIDSISYQKNGLPVYTVKYKQLNGFMSRQDVIKRGTATFTLISTYDPRQTDSNYVNRFFNSFQLRPVQSNAEWETFTDNDSSFTIKTPAYMRFNILAIGWDHLAGASRKVYTAWDTASQARYRVSVISFDENEQAAVSSGFMSADADQTIISSTNYKTGDLPTWELTLQAKNHYTREYRKALISGQKAYIIQAFLPEEMASTGYGQRFLNSFRLLKSEAMQQ
ncbi:TraB/GumN family protein [Chitinophaga silvisoli]|uniref:DUF3857 domain-containing protein n=1 Tax=Chitinophaga silvisoli TaxID=2291814 RepID=A0A3E1NSY0_9BACT|nr:TraB/GumN family protein [Chitinophaga silvisoli]RFM31035.1 hypothetical protein DXN04_31215 [Chitinophaga silvisoli]